MVYNVNSRVIFKGGVILKKVSIYIDLYNFLAYAFKYLGGRAFLDFTKMHNYFINSDETLEKVKIYGGGSMEGLVYKLSHYPYIEVFKESIGWDKKDKRTDVNIAVDMLVDAFYNRYDKAVLLSGDTDFIKAVDEVRNLKKTVFIATTEGDGIYNARKLIAHADGSYELNKDFFQRYWLKNTR